MTEQAGWGHYALTMAQRQAEYLFGHLVREDADQAVSLAVHLITDCVQHLHEPALAVQVALGVHPVAERRAAWGLWATALDALLKLDEDAYGVADRIRLLHGLTHAACELGNYAAATAAAQMALQLAQAHGDQMLAALSLHQRAFAAYHGDDLAVAQTHWQRAYQLGLHVLPPIKLGHISMDLGLIAVARGQFDEAHVYFNQAWTYYHELNDTMFLAKLQCNLADLQRREGRLHDTPTLLLAARETFLALGARYEYGLAENDLGCVYLAQQQFEQALGAFHRSIEAFNDIRSLNGKALALSNLAELFVTTAHWAEAKTTLQEARDLAVLCNKPLLVAAIDVDSGRMLAAVGKHKEARRLWEAVLAVQSAKGALEAVRHTQRLLDDLLPES